MGVRVTRIPTQMNQFLLLLAQFLNRSSVLSHKFRVWVLRTTGSRGKRFPKLSKTLKTPASRPRIDLKIQVHHHAKKGVKLFQKLPNSDARTGIHRGTRHRADCAKNLLKSPPRSLYASGDTQTAVAAEASKPARKELGETMVVLREPPTPQAPSMALCLPTRAFVAFARRLYVKK